MPSTVISAPQITCDQIMPAVGDATKIHGEAISHKPKTGSVHVMPWVRSSAEPKHIARTATVIPTIRSLKGSRVKSLKPRIYGARATYVAVSNVRPNVACAVIDSAARVVRRAGKPVTLSAREFALLEYLALRRGQIVTRAEIWGHVYDFAAEPSSNVVDVYVGYLRRKLARDGRPAPIETVRSIGYRLRDG